MNYKKKGKQYYYFYIFLQEKVIVFWLTVLIIALACLLIGWERSYQSNTLLMTMPFKRKDVFLSKWAFGSFCIVGSLLFNWVLMYVIYRTPIHFDYQSFSPFSSILSLCDSFLMLQSIQLPYVSVLLLEASFRRLFFVFHGYY